MDAEPILNQLHLAIIKHSALVLRRGIFIRILKDFFINFANSYVNSSISSSVFTISADFILLIKYLLVLSSSLQLWHQFQVFLPFCWRFVWHIILFMSYLCSLWTVREDTIGTVFEVINLFLVLSLNNFSVAASVYYIIFKVYEVFPVE